MSMVAYFFMFSGGAWLSYVTVWFGLLAVMQPKSLKAVKDKKQSKAKSASANALRRRSAYYRRSSSAEEEERFEKFYVNVDQFDTYSTPKMFGAKKRGTVGKDRHVPSRLDHLDLRNEPTTRVRGSSVA